MIGILALVNSESSPVFLTRQDLQAAPNGYTVFGREREAV